MQPASSNCSSIASAEKSRDRHWGTATTAPPINLLRIEETLSAAHLRLAASQIERLDWAKCVDRYDRPHTFFYMDPPYLKTEGYGVPFPVGEYEKMASMMRLLQGKAIVNINDHPVIREIFSGFQLDELSIDYTVGGGGKAARRGELLIYSWDREQEPAGLF